jgi:hypothetical protein
MSSQDQKLLEIQLEANRLRDAGRWTEAEYLRLLNEAKRLLPVDEHWKLESLVKKRPGGVRLAPVIVG